MIQTGRITADESTEYFVVHTPDNPTNLSGYADIVLGLKSLLKRHQAISLPGEMHFEDLPYEPCFFNLAYALNGSKVVLQGEESPARNKLHLVITGNIPPEFLEHLDNLILQ